jgi:predicted nucleic acid-binding protein
MPLLLDSFALLRFLQREPGGTAVRDLLQQATTGGAPLLLNVINFGEVLYTVQRRFGPEVRMKTFIAVRQMGLVILPCPEELVYRAAELKAAFAMSYADTFALASAIEHRATLVTGDPEFRQAEHLVKVQWI